MADRTIVVNSVQKVCEPQRKSFRPRETVLFYYTFICEQPHLNVKMLFVEQPHIIVKMLNVIIPVAFGFVPRLFILS